MSIGLVGSALVACLALSLTGCAAIDGTPRNVSKSTAKASPSPTVVASPTPSLDPVLLQKRVEAATIAPAGLASIGVQSRPREEDAGPAPVNDLCNRWIPADRPGAREGVKAGYFRQWSADGWFINHQTYGFRSPVAADVVAQIKEAARCSIYRIDDQFRTVLDTVSLPKYPGVEASYAFCEHIKRPRYDYIWCQAFIAKSNVVSSVAVIHGDTEKTSTTGLIAVAAIAAETLNRAA